MAIDHYADQLLASIPTARASCRSGQQRSPDRGAPDYVYRFGFTTLGLPGVKFPGSSEIMC